MHPDLHEEGSQAAPLIGDRIGTAPLFERVAVNDAFRGRPASRFVAIWSGVSWNLSHILLCRHGTELSARADFRGLTLPGPENWRSR